MNNQSAPLTQTYIYDYRYSYEDNYFFVNGQTRAQKLYCNRTNYMQRRIVTSDVFMPDLGSEHPIPNPGSQRYRIRIKEFKNF
jgi:hypothetical protein